MERIHTQTLPGDALGPATEPVVLPDHLRTGHWYCDIHLKSGSAGCRTIAGTMTEFLEHVVSHINEVDQNTYGKASSSTEESLIQSMEILSGTHLPLSPQMAGCHQVAECLAPRMTTLMRPESLSPLAMEKIKTFLLQPRREPLLGEGPGSFRDLFFAHYGNRRQTTNKAELPTACF